MNSRIIIAIASLTVAFVGCATDRQAGESIITETNQITEIHMLNRRQGWAWTSGFPGQGLLLHTDDGGVSWRDITPRGFYYTEEGACFRDAKTAWVPIFNKTNITGGLLRTTDAGKSWSLLNQTNTPIFNEASSCRFFSPTYGIGNTADGGLGNSYYTFFETHDAGRTWSPIPVTPRHPESNQPYTFHLSNIGEDRIAFFPPATTIITYGDTADEQPTDAVRLSLTTDLGKTWCDLKLRLPQTYRDCLCAPLEPIFLDRKNVILAAHVFKPNPNGSYPPGVLIFYTSRDGGVTWTLRPGIVDLKQPWYGNLNVISPKCFIAANGATLSVTHDAAQTWQIITPNISFGGNSKREIVRMDFVDAIHGWMTTYEQGQSPRNERFGYYRTSDGGKNWTELPVQMFASTETK